MIPPTALEAGEENNGFLNAFGMFWRRDEVDWDKRGQTLLGAQLKVAKPVNFLVRSASTFFTPVRE